ncbi:uncharacterized protein B0H18DRAFT_878858, partial [Fomitopsis serialis]|uniref:uncharacterized protein n=1 Tax=Fomitopsis serialis TaxID=139415 RepID=UPI002008B59C
MLGPVGPLVFQRKPDATSPPYQLQDSQTLAPANSGPHALSVKNPENASFLEQEEWLVSLVRDVIAAPAYNDAALDKARADLLSYLHRELDGLERVKAEQWERYRRTKKTYVYQNMKEWMARFLSRPDIEPVIDARRNLAHAALPDIRSDIWDAPVFRNFKDATGRTFIDGPEGEGRYLFSLTVDGFNPFQAKEAKQKVSISGIYMVCMNLPPDMRYLPENMYLVGIVP